jgi:hypothetical protein
MHVSAVECTCKHWKARESDSLRWQENNSSYAVKEERLMQLKLPDSHDGGCQDCGIMRLDAVKLVHTYQRFGRNRCRHLVP